MSKLCGLRLHHVEVISQLGTIRPPMTDFFCRTTCMQDRDDFLFGYTMLHCLIFWRL